MRWKNRRVRQENCSWYTCEMSKKDINCRWTDWERSAGGLASIPTECVTEAYHLDQWKQRPGTLVPGVNKQLHWQSHHTRCVWSGHSGVCDSGSQRRAGRSWSTERERERQKKRKHQIWANHTHTVKVQLFKIRFKVTANNIFRGFNMFSS